MLSTNDSIFQEAGATMYDLSEDERMQEMLEAREDARRNASSLQRHMQGLQKRVDETESKLNAMQAELDTTQAKLDAAIIKQEELQKMVDSYQKKYGSLG